jgi:hypothetical protein
MNLRRTFRDQQADRQRVQAWTNGRWRSWFVAPIVVLGLLGWVIRGQGEPETRLAVVNAAGAPGERIKAGIEQAAADAGIVVEQVADEPAARDALRDGDVDVVLVLPDDLLANQSAPPALRFITPGINPADDGGRVARVQAALLPALAGSAFPSIEPETIYGSPNGDQLDAFAPAAGRVLLVLSSCSS